MYQIDAPPIELCHYIVLPVGLEPTAHWLKASCSTLELRQSISCRSLSYRFPYLYF
jgi:hypothetical protein